MRDGPLYMQAASGGLANSLGLYSDRFTSSDAQTAIMVKKFSVDWLAQSFHDLEALEPEKKTHRPHVPCVVQPRPPTSYDKVYLQPKPKVTKAEQKPETGKEKATTPVTQRSCSSPSCKYTRFNAFSVFIRVNDNGACFNVILHVQFQKTAAIRLVMRAKRPRLNALPSKMDTRLRRTRRRAESEPNSLRNRSTNWRKSSPSTNTWTREKE